MIYFVSLEPLETRYTAQWRRWFLEEFEKNKSIAIEIFGITTSEINNSKNFLDPFQTNIWKSEQIIEISNLFKNNKIKKGDIFVHFDAWNYSIIAIKYMATLSNIEIKQYGIWHAGSYDDNDLLGQLGLFNYFNGFEESLFNSLDKSFVATKYHKELILSKFKNINKNKILVTGFPYKFEELDNYKEYKKEDIIVFPHRLSEEKQSWILKDLEPELKKLGYFVIFCQEKKLTKNEYHKILAESKFCFSASLQETWGIGLFEAMYLNSQPIIPDRLSYKEMYKEEFKYPNYWTINKEKYLKYKEKLLYYIEKRIQKYDEYDYLCKINIDELKNSVCRSDKMIKEILND